MTKLYVHLLPDLIASEALRGATVVVIDVLRATTTIVQALAAGAREVIPCLEVDEARRVASGFAQNERVLGGERHGVRIDGFDLGNSPAEYTPESVGGRTLVFTTTNGTRAMRHASQARAVLLAGLVNRQAVAVALHRETTAHILCAGTDGQITLEDVVTAGAVAEGLLSLGGSGTSGNCELANDQARLALDAWEAAQRTGVLAAFQASLGGRNLIAEGFDADLPRAARLDIHTLVPALDSATGRVSILMP
jgi:2-phosphosulfolactate phosphatase